MLANLLPGFRDLRTPLVAGYAWLACVWLILAPDVPESRPAGGLSAGVWDLAHLVGRPGSLAAVSVVAFLAGALLQVGTRPLAFAGRTLVRGSTVERLGARHKANIDRWVRGKLARFGSCENWSEPLQFAEDLPLGLQGHMDQRVDALKSDGSRPNYDAIDDAYIESIVEGVYEERAALTTRLQLERQPVYDDYDRLSAEASFRGSLVGPIALAIVAAAAIEAWPYLFLLPVPLSLAWQAAVRQLEADAKLWGALLGDYIESPTMQKVLEIMINSRVTSGEASEAAAHRRRDQLDEWRKMLVTAVSHAEQLHDGSGVKLPTENGYGSLAPHLPPELRVAIEEDAVYPDFDGERPAYTDYPELLAVAKVVENLERQWFPTGPSPSRASVTP